MAQARFYLLDPIGDDKLLSFVCQQVSTTARQHRRVLVVANDKQQAEALDELLWQLPAEAFVPHGLTGEAAAHGAPVEITWASANPGTPWPVVINLADSAPSQAARAQLVIDFVPQQSAARTFARERYKQYRQVGMALHTEPAALAVTN